MGAVRSTCGSFKRPRGAAATRNRAGRVANRGGGASAVCAAVHTEGCARKAVHPACRSTALFHVSAIMVGTHLGVETNVSTQKAPEMSGDQARSQKTRRRLMLSLSTRRA